MYSETTATTKILALKKRIRGIAGGTSASKTISILLWLIDYAQSHEGELLSVVSETMPHLRKGAMRDFENIMKTHSYWKEANWNATNSVYNFETGSIIEFFSADSSDKVRGPRRDVLFLNEANNVSYETYDQLVVRTRKIIFLDWNPVQEFWWYTDVLPNRDVDFIVLTYKDNEALSDEIVADIESHMGNKNWWRVYGEGKLGLADGLIYPNWQQIDDVPLDARLERYGLDFGYTNDPTASDAIYKWNDAFVIDQVIHQKGLSNKQIADIFLNLPRALVVADSAEPKSIDEISSYGISIMGTVKGKDSVNQGIQYVQDQKIFVTKRSIETLKEQRNYMWITDKDGKIINTPSPIFNHHMDDIRYAFDSYKPRDPEQTKQVVRENAIRVNKWAI